jgi:hypothetical protein
MVESGDALELDAYFGGIVMCFIIERMTESP